MIAGSLPYKDKAASAFYAVQPSLMSVLPQCLQLLSESFSLTQSKLTKQKAQQPKKAQGKSPLEAAGGNAAIAAILEKYQKKATQNTSSSILADLTPVLKALPTLTVPEGPASSSLLEAHFGSEDELNHTIALCTALSHLFAAAQSRPVVHCTPRALDDKLFLNTGDLVAKLPVWALCFDVSACSECGPITGLMVSRLTFAPVASKGKGQGAPLESISSTRTNDPMFCEALGLSVSTNFGPFTPVDKALLIDAEVCLSDMLHSAFFYGAEEDDAEASADAGEHILSSELRGSAELMSLVAALRYVVYFLSHQDELEGDASFGGNCAQSAELTNPSAVSYKDGLGACLKDGALWPSFAHYKL